MSVNSWISHNEVNYPGQRVRPLKDGFVTAIIKGTITHMAVLFGIPAKQKS